MTVGELRKYIQNMPSDIPITFICHNDENPWKDCCTVSKALYIESSSDKDGNLICLIPD
jgi:hypothetical protein